MAVAVATHEIGHAIQFSRNEPVTLLRGKYLAKAQKIKSSGIYILMSIPVVSVAFRIPYISIITLGIGVVTMLASVLMYAAILHEEYDASFNKALPILEEGYVPKQYLPTAHSILKACAFTYVAGALVDILRLWRWLAIIR